MKKKLSLKPNKNEKKKIFLNPCQGSKSFITAYSINQDNILKFANNSNVPFDTENKIDFKISQGEIDQAQLISDKFIKNKFKSNNFNFNACATKGKKKSKNIKWTFKPKRKSECKCAMK